MIDMRTLLLMQGAMGSCKSKWIAENNLEQYTLSPDLIRTMVQSPEMNEDGKLYIPQKNDKYVWNLMFQILEDRMKRGDFTVIDATHSNDKMIKQYKDLCDTYKYTLFIKRMDTSLEDCLKYNRQRDEYKFVPEDKVKLAYSKIQCIKDLKWYNYINDISEISNFYIEDFNKYNKVFVIGDIHGCIEPLNDFFEQNPFDEENAYVFLGDYIDRGLDNLAVMNKMIELSKYKNVFLLEGNHEDVLLPYSKGLESGKKTFDDSTAKELQSIDKGWIKLFYKKLRQCLRLTYKGKEYLLTHGGLPTNPKNITYISSRQLIKGVGNYDFDVDREWYENVSDVIQVHGHRSMKDYKNPISLEGEVEFGGHLKYVELSEDNLNVRYIKNNKYISFEKVQEQQKERKGLKTKDELVNKISRSTFVKCKSLKNNVVSLNFTSNCFNKKAWNDLTVKARGLFVDKESGKVVARGYNKFFNLNERRDTTLRYVEENYTFPLKVYKKYNGYLGIISHINGELYFYTKSTDDGDYPRRFKEIFYKYTTQEYRDRLLKILVENDCSLTCEVIDIDNDYHIIEHNPKECIYMLNLIENKLDDNYRDDLFFSCIAELNMSSLNTFSKNIKTKELETTIYNKEELHSIVNNLLDTTIEGYVIEDCNKRMFKLKTNFYTEWKSCRHFVHKIISKGGYFELRLSDSVLQAQFGSWYSKNFNKLGKLDNVLILRKMFLESVDLS